MWVSSSSTFIRAFRKYYGTTPEGFRKLSLKEISKIGTSKPHIGKYSDHHSAEFWSLNLINEEVTGLTTELNIEVKTIRSLNVVFMDTHLGDKKFNALKEINRILKPGGRMLMIGFTPNLTSFAILNFLSFMLTSRKQWKKLFNLTNFRFIEEGEVNGGTYFLIEK